MNTEAKDETNIEFLNRVMDFSKHGAMMQLFVLDAIYKQAKQVIEQKEQLIENWRNQLIHPNTWIGTAEEFIREYEAKYGKVN